MNALDKLSISLDFIEAARRYHLDQPTEQDRQVLQQAQWQRLEGGRNNGVYSTQYPSGKYCFKFYKTDGRNRDQREWAALRYLSAKGCSHIIAQPFYYQRDDRAPLIIQEFIEGRHLGYSHLDKSQLDALFEHVQQLQAIPYEASENQLDLLDSPMRMTNLQRFMDSAAYFTQETRDCLALWKAWTKSEDATYVNQALPLFFSRLDTSLANCLWDGQKLYFIDLEYSGWVERIYDLAELVEHDQSRGTPDTEWDAFVERFALTAREHRQYLAAQRLLAFTWGRILWPKKKGEVSRRFRTQVKRISHLCSKL